MNRIFLISLLVLAVTACGKKEEASQNPTQSSVTAPVSEVLPVSSVAASSPVVQDISASTPVNTEKK